MEVRKADRPNLCRESEVVVDYTELAKLVSEVKLSFLLGIGCILISGGACAEPRKGNLKELGVAGEGDLSLAGPPMGLTRSS